MDWRSDPSPPFNPHGGRNAFKNAGSQEETDEHPLSRTARAMRSFTESIDCDVPPVPELPPSLDIDLQMKNSDTNDTIIEVIRTQTTLDHTLGETQKYKMSVPGPGQTEQETELHKSLLKDNDSDIDSELESIDNLVPKDGPPEKPARADSINKRPPQDAEHAALRQQYSTSALSRPRPTTPTQSCAIESAAFVEREEKEERMREQERAEKAEKIKVKIPSGGKRRKSEMTYSDFYDNMERQIPNQNRSNTSGRTTPLNDYDGDILEEDPEYRSKAPPKPVVNRRSSVEWENFEERMQAKLEEEAAEIKRQKETSEKKSLEEKAFGKTTTENQMEDHGFADSFAADTPATNKQATMDESEPEPQFSEDMAEERERCRRLSENDNKQPSITDSERTMEPSEEETVTPQPENIVQRQLSKTSQGSVIHKSLSNDVVGSVDRTVDESSTVEEQPTTTEPHQQSSTEGHSEVTEYDASAVHAEGYDQYEEHDHGYYDEHGQPVDYAQYPGWNSETYQFEGTYTDENGVEQSYAEYYHHYFANNFFDKNGQPYVTHDTTEEHGEVHDPSAYYSHEQAVVDESGQQTSETHEQYPEHGQEHEEGHAGYDPNYEYDAEYYNSEEYKKWYAENYGDAGAENYDYSQYPQDGQPAEYSHEGEHSGYAQEGQHAEYATESQGQEGHQEGQDYPQQDYDHNQQYANTNGYDYSQDYSQNTQQDYTAEETAAEQSTEHTEPIQEAPIEEVSTLHYTEAEHIPEETHQPPPRPPVFSKPLFEAAPAPSDPFAWNAPAADVAPVSPSRPPPPTKEHGKAEEEKVEEEVEEKEHEEKEAPARPAPPPARPAPAARPPPPRPVPPPQKKVEEVVVKKEDEPEEDAWTHFKRMTEKVNVAVKSSEDTLKNLHENTAINEIKDESYMAEVGGTQGYVPTLAHKEIQRKAEEKKNEKLVKKKMKQQGKRAASPQYDQAQEDKMNQAAEELARQMAAKLAMGNSAMADWKPPGVTADRKDSQPLDAIPPRKKSSIAEAHQESSSLDLPSHAPLTFQQSADSAQPIGDFHPDDPALTAPSWADFDTSTAVLPPSESGFFSKDGMSAPPSGSADPFAPPPKVDPFAAIEEPNLLDDNYDPFDVRPVEDIVAAAKAKAEAAKMSAEAADDMDFFGTTERRSNLSTPTQEGGSPVSARPTGFEDDFKCEGVSAMSTPTPLYDEDDSQPLDDYLPKFLGEGWELMIRHPLKKKIMADRFWKPCFVRLHGTTLLIYNSKSDVKPIQEMLLQATYSLSDTTLQAYDVYGKIHTVKLQYVLYKEKVGIRPGQISRLVEGHVTKYGLPLEHSAQCTVLLKFGSLNAPELQSFVNTIEDVLFKCPAKRDTKPQYKQDEVQIHCYDEYSCHVDKDGLLSDQKARVRLFCLAFVSGSPILEIGLNDRRRQGKEIVRRKDILPMYTERWIRFENLEFHNTVDQPEFEKEHVIRVPPPDGCFFEIMRFRIRPPRNREKALTIKSIMKIAGSKVEIRLEAMAAAQVERSKGGKSTRRQIPCEDITIRFPIPEAWIYIFREERHWGVGSVHSKKMRPGKVKNLKDRLLGAVQTSENNLIECAIGEAKYEHVYRSLVWRIPRLPEKHHAAYKGHLLKCRFELSSFDLMPETFLPTCEVDFTMPLATVSNTVVRSVSVEQHEDSDRVEKYVRYVAKCQYKVEIDYVQCTDLDVDAIMDPSANVDEVLNTVPELHKPAIQPTDVAQMHEGYRIDIPESQYSAKKDDDSSSDEEEVKKFPTIQIDMSNYGY